MTKPRTKVNVQTLDARSMEPPLPFIRALEALETLKAGTSLRLLTRWRPALLFPELERRGFASESEELSDGSYVTHIRRD